MVLVTPSNFSWLLAGRIAALAFPEKKEELEFLVDQGVKYLVTLTAEMKPRIEEVPALVGVDISVEDFGTFSMEQVQKFIEICETALREEKVINAIRRSFFQSLFRLKNPRVLRFTAELGSEEQVLYWRVI